MCKTATLSFTSIVRLISLCLRVETKLNKQWVILHTQQCGGCCSPLMSGLVIQELGLPRQNLLHLRHTPTLHFWELRPAAAPGLCCQTTALAGGDEFHPVMKWASVAWRRCQYGQLVQTSQWHVGQLTCYQPVLGHDWLLVTVLSVECWVSLKHRVHSITAGLYERQLGGLPRPGTCSSSFRVRQNKKVIGQQAACAKCRGVWECQINPLEPLRGLKV